MNPARKAAVQAITKDKSKWSMYETNGIPRSLRSGAYEARVALSAWPESAVMFEMPLEAVTFLADEGNHAAILLYAAVAHYAGTHKEQSC